MPRPPHDFALFDEISFVWLNWVNAMHVFLCAGLPVCTLVSGRLHSIMGSFELQPTCETCFNVHVLIIRTLPNVMYTYGIRNLYHVKCQLQNECKHFSYSYVL